MTRTIVSVFANNDHVSFNLYLAPGNIPNARDLYDFGCSENDIPFVQMNRGLLSPDVVKCAGTHLFESLSKHPAVRDAVTFALTTQNKVAPLYVYLNAEKAESLPWETLYDQVNTFLALDERWPIARIADSSAMVPMMNRTFRPPLKLSLALSAAGVDSIPEWEAFFNAINKETDIDLMIQVFVCQRELKTAIEELHDNRVTVQFLTSRFDFLEAVKKFGPHILHFFCHGSTDGGPHLQLATLADWDGGDPRGSIVIVPNDLYQFSSFANSGTAWLIALNCCEGGAAVSNAATSQDAYSLARLLVTNGFPAAVGMREPIASDDAHIFCQAFYSSVLSELQQAKSATDFIEFEWAKALYQSRTQLCDQHRNDQTPLNAAATTKEWTLPIMYVRPELFMIRMRSTSSNLSADEVETLRAQLKVLRTARGFLQTLPDFPQEAFADIDGRIAMLEAELYA